MELDSLKYIGVGLTALGMLGAALGVSNIFVALLNGIARNPSAEPKMAKYHLIGAALTEFMGLLAGLLGILIFFL